MYGENIQHGRTGVRSGKRTTAESAAPRPYPRPPAPRRGPPPPGRRAAAPAPANCTWLRAILAIRAPAYVPCSHAACYLLACLVVLLSALQRATVPACLDTETSHPLCVCVGGLLQTDPQERAKTTTASLGCRPRPTAPDPVVSHGNSQVQATTGPTNAGEATGTPHRSTRAQARNIER